jgi:hypothetical protein
VIRRERMFSRPKGSFTPKSVRSKVRKNTRLTKNGQPRSRGAGGGAWRKFVSE